MGAEATFQVCLASGARELGESLWAARHIVARRVAFANDPLSPREVLPAEIWQLDPKVFGGRVYVETIHTASELTAITQDP
ncbi:MAG TPA: hypothetical protein VGM80_14615 [Gaiellaceae bacterium]